MTPEIKQILEEIKTTNSMSVRMPELIKQLKTELNKKQEKK